MKKEVEFYAVSVSFLVRHGADELIENEEGKAIEILAEIVRDGIGGNDMNCLDCEDVTVMVDGKVIR